MRGMSENELVQALNAKADEMRRDGYGIIFTHNVFGWLEVQVARPDGREIFLPNSDNPAHLLQHMDSARWLVESVEAHKLSAMTD